MENEEILNYIKRAFELREQECYKQAVEMLYKALNLEPDNIDIMYQLGEVYFLMENYSRAIQYPEQILSLEPNNIQALTLLEKIYLNQNNLYSAKETAEKLYSVEKNDKNLANLIRIYGLLGLYDDIEIYKDQIAGNPNCLYEYAKILHKKNDVENSLRYVEMALEKESENEEYVVLKGQILYDSGKQDEALELFENFDNNTHNPDVQNYKGLFALDRMDFVEAVKFFSKAINIDKHNAKYYYNLGNAYFLNGWLEEAVSAYKNAIMHAPENLDYRYSLAYLYINNSQFDKAQSEVEIILSKEPNHPGANVIKSLLLFNKGNILDAEKVILSNIENGYDDDYTLCTFALIEKDLGKYDLAEKYLAKVIERNPENLSHKCDMCDLYVCRKDYQKAMSIADDIVNIDENYIAGYISGAYAALAAEDEEKLKNYAQNILAIDINCAQGYYFLALARKMENDLEEALECMKRAILHDVNNPKYYAETAKLYELLDDYKTAFEYAKEAESICDSEEYKILYKKYAALTRK